MKMTEMLCLVVAMASFFSIHTIEDAEQSSAYFVTAMIVSSFLQTGFLCVIYVFGGSVIQKTLYEIMVNAFYCFMLFVTALVLFVFSDDDTGAVASGVFSLFACGAYGYDTYLAVVASGATSPAATGAPPVVTPATPAPFNPPAPYSPPTGLEGNGTYGGAHTGAHTAPHMTTVDLGGNRV